MGYRARDALRARLTRGLERGLDRGLDSLVRSVADLHAVGEDRRRPADARLQAVGHVALNLLGEAARVEGGVELRAVEPRARRVLLQLIDLQSGSVLKQQRDVLPVLALLARGLCGLGRLLRVGVLREREVAND